MKIGFWEFIDQTRSRISGSLDGHMVFWEECLGSLSSQERFEYGRSYLEAVNSLDCLKVWEAGSLLLGSPIGDDSFLYFRNWIIWKGKAFYEDMLSRPDDAICNCIIETGGPLLEALSGLGEEVAGDDRDSGASASQPQWNWTESSKEKISKEFPKAWAKYGSKFFWDLSPSPAGSSETVEIQGIGRLSVGDEVRHIGEYGVGKILSFPLAGRSIAVIKFSAEEKAMDIAPPWFEKVHRG